MEKGSVDRRILELSLKEKREFDSSNNLLRTSLSLPPISLRFLVDRSCVTPSAIQKEDSQEVLTFTRSTENKIHFPPSHQEPSIKQRGDSSLKHLPSLVVGVLIRCNFSFDSRKFYEETSPTKQYYYCLLYTSPSPRDS